MLSNHDIESILSEVSIGNLAIRVRYDGERPYLQVICAHGTDTKTGESTSWTGRKWVLSPHMCKTELVRTAYKAYIAALEHEAQECFKYKGAAIYSPHMNVDILADLWVEPYAIDFEGNTLPIEDTRPNGMQAQ